MENIISKNLLSFIKNSPTSFHAISTIKKTLVRENYVELKENKPFEIVKGGKYYVTRNDSSIIAFKVGEELDKYAFNIVASHSDSPMFKIKQEADLGGDGYAKLNAEVYGGFIFSSWLDRPLSVAGRVIVNDNDKLVSKLVNFDKNMVIIPNVCIHFNRTVNDGYKYNPACDMVGITNLNNEKFKSLVAKELKVNEENINQYDLFIYNRQEGVFAGANDEFIMSPRIDDLQCAYTTLMGFIKASNTHNISMYCCFDNEEVGSTTRQGANSTFLEDIIDRINNALKKSKDELYQAIDNSFMISADNAHAVHPNHPELTDQDNKVYMNKGIVIKYNAAQSYTSDSVSGAIFKEICKKVNVPTQVFANRSNIRGGGTLGNISTTHVSLKTVDIGLAQLAMHSAFETSGTEDSEYMQLAIKEFYSSYFVFDGDETKILK